MESNFLQATSNPVVSVDQEAGALPKGEYERLALPQY